MKSETQPPLPQLPDTTNGSRFGFDARKLEPYRQHVLAKIAQTSVSPVPFSHLFIEDVFPVELYGALHARMLQYKFGENLLERHQDSAQFVNRRHSLVGSGDAETQALRSIFSNSEVRLALLGKFYVDPTADLERSLAIHEEFEFVYTAAGRFQNIHIDIPPKFMSFVFYFPEREPEATEAARNATILYDKQLSPHYRARYQSNSVCIFVPHFYSYHGFASTIDRNALVMFYINQAEQQKWIAARLKDEPPYSGLKNAIQSKLLRFPLLEYGTSEQRILHEREQCLVNAPQGRVMRTQ